MWRKKLKDIRAGGNLPLLVILATLLVAGWASFSQAQPVETGAAITGEIEAITLTTPGNVWSGGTMTVGGQVIILPANLLIDLPNDYQTLQQLYVNAPAACLVTGETGLGKADKCNAQAKGAQATILANRTISGNVIAGVVGIAKANEIVNGNITYIDSAQGYFRLNGVFNDPNTGVMVRINDPTSRHTVQSGLGCVVANTVNCSPDVRFKVDPDNYTFSYATGYPSCIPRGASDLNCPATNRPAPLTALSPTQPFTAVIITNNPAPAPPVAADSRHFAPIQLGDFVTATGGFETVQAVTFLSAWSARVWVDLTTRTIDPLSGLPDLTQPDYVFIDANGFDGAGWPAGRVRGRVRSAASDHNAIIDYFTIHYDPASNLPHQRILYTTQFNKQQGPVVFNVGPTGAFDSQIRMDFFVGAKSLGGEPCKSLLGLTVKSTGVPVIPGVNVPSFCSGAVDGTPQDFIDNFNLLVPNARETLIRTRRDGLTQLPVDILGRPAQSGHYKLPTSIAYGAFDDINLAMLSFPLSFSGTTWLLDRRLSPNGCIGVCEATQQPLTPFPFEGYDPRLISPNFGNSVLGPAPLPTPNQPFKFMDAAGNLTGLLAWPPTAPAAFPIVATPPLNLFPPIADEDFAVTTIGVPVIINVLANDIAVFGVIDPASVKIASTPGTGLVQVNPNGTITYTPTPAFTVGNVTFTYTVANNYGSVSLPGTVNVTILRPPVAVNDTATVPAKSSIFINVVANDIAGTNLINIATTSIFSQPPAGCGSVVNLPQDGLMLYIAPATVPAAPGTCSFTYTVSDTSVPPVVSNIAIVTVTITPAVAPVAVNDVATITTGSTIAINVIANDTSAVSTINPASLAVTAPTGAIAPNTNSGTAASNPNGSVSYTAPLTPGTYTFTYTVKDNVIPPNISNVATVTVTVTQGPVAVNDTSATTAGASVVINVIANDTVTAPATINPASLTVTTPTGGTATANPNGTVTYTAPTATGIYTFTYTMKDNAIPPSTSNVALVTVTVAAAAAPVAVNDTAATSLGATIPINVIANDKATAPATINPASIIVTAPTGAVTPNINSGTALANPNGTVSYTAPPVAGVYTFTYTVKDSNVPPSISNVATVTVTVTATPAPLANNDIATVAANGTVGINVIANDTATAPAAINQASVVVTTPTGGAATANANGTVTYAAPAVAGTYTFTYTVKDSSVPPVISNVATVTVTVTAATPATGVTATAAPVATQTVNVPVTITAAGIGGTGAYEYRFYVNDGGTFYLIQPYSTANTSTWLPGKPGVVDFFVEVRSAGTTVLRDAFTQIFAYVVTSPAATAVTLTPSAASPHLLAAGPVTFTAQGVGGIGIYEYQFWLNTGAGFAVVKPYSTVNTFVLAPTVAGTNDIFVEVRMVGSTVGRDAFNKIVAYQIQ